ncbi:App1 family protein [Halomonas sp. DQ26W]|uniref:App1 family protein n=1 Tax=Halomonas sp. DQ26W TaxID=2282311 RepID=UPI0021629C41|nr:phosphatase domain-containing protein [Halomonas sp. DQ26W]
MADRPRAPQRIRRLLRAIARPMKSDRGRGGPVVHPYRGYGSTREAFLMGRVFRQTRLGRVIPPYGAMRDVADVARRVIRRGLPDVEVHVTLGGNDMTVTTDRDGYFNAKLALHHPLPLGTSWHRADLHVVTHGGAEPIHSFTDVYIPPQNTDLLVISDIDDTVMYTGVADKLRMLYRLFVKQAHQRTAFPGVAAFYQALYIGQREEARRPILYVSRGPWSIYEMLEEFFQINDIPVGPILFLREWGISLRRPWPRRAEEHKYALITRMLALFDDLPCVLIGDSGQHDPEVYTRIVKDHPGRVKAIYIRRVESRADRERAIDLLREEIDHTDCELQLAADSTAMAVHARERGFISESGLQAVRRDSREETI